MIYRAGLAAVVVAGLMSFGAATPAAAQGSLNPIKKPQAASGCPGGWRDRPKEVSGTKAGYDTCYPDKGAKKAYVRPTSRVCAEGYVGSGSYCVEGYIEPLTSTAGALIKAHPLDRCPVGYFTVPSDGNACTTLAANPPKVRRKGDTPCGPGEIEDWGVYCVSDYGQLTRKDAAKGIADYNGIYQNSYRLTGKQQASHWPALPEGTEYTPAYFLIFGRVDRDGNPFPGGAGDTSNPVAAATDAAKTECKVPAPAKKRGLGGLGAALNQAVAAVTGEAGC